MDFKGFLFDKIAKDENVSKKVVRHFALPIVYACGFKDLMTVEKNIKKVIREAKKIGLINVH